MADIPASQQHVLVDAKVLVSRTAFVGHSFQAQDQPIVSYLKELLREMEVICSTGEQAEATEIHEKVKRRILAAEYFVGIFTKRHKIEDKDQWTTADWVVQEMTFAAANKKKLIIMREAGVIDFGNLHGNLEYIEFNRAELHLATIKLLQTLSSLNPSRMRIGSDRSLMQADALRIAVEANPREPMLRVALASALKTQGMFQAALDAIDEVLLLFPELPSALIGKAQILRSKGQHSEANELLNSLGAKYPSDANILHELGHLLADQGNFVEAERAFEGASDCQPTQARHLECLAGLLFKTGAQDERKLQKVTRLCSEIKGIGGEKNAAGADKLLIAVQNRLERLSSRNKGRNKGRPK